MTEELALSEIVRTLTVDHGCHAVILYGSRARGDFQPTSDWDVAGIREGGETAPLRVARAFYGTWLDAFVYAEAALTVVDPEMLRFLPARILVDERGFAKALLERVDALDQEGPPLLPEGEDEMVRVWYLKMLGVSPVAIWRRSTAGSSCSSKRWKIISSCVGFGIAGPRRGCHGWRGTTPRHTQRSRAPSSRMRLWTIYVCWFGAFSPRRDTARGTVRGIFRNTERRPRAHAANFDQKKSTAPKGALTP